MDSTLRIIVIGRVLQIVLALVSVRIYTKLLSTYEVGNFYLIGSITGLIALTMISPVGMYINRRIHKWADDKTIISYFFIYNIYLIFLSFFSVFIVYVLNKFMGIGSGIDFKLLSLFISLNIYFSTWNLTIIPFFNMLNYRNSFVFFTLTTLTLGLALSILLVELVDSTAVFWLSGQLIAQIATTVFAFAYFKKVTKTAFDFGFAKRVMTWDNFAYLMTFAMPLGVTTFFVWVQNQSYRMIIEKHIGLDFLGMFGVGIGVAASISAAVESLAQQIYYPIYYSEINTTDPAKRSVAWNKMAQLTIPVYVSLAVFLSCLAPYLVKILVSDKFSQAYVFVIYGSLVEMCRMSANVLSGVAYSEMKTTSLVKSYFTGGLVVLVGVYYGAKTVNYQHIIPTLLVISGFVTMLIMYWDMKKLMPININFKQIGKSIVYSLPFAAALYFNSKAASMVISLLIVGIFGLYFISLQYLIYKSTIRNIS